MQRRMFVLATIVSLMAVAVPAHGVPPTDVIPFDVAYTFGPQEVRAEVGQSGDTGLVGFCDPEVGCTGFRITESTSDVSATVGEGRVTLQGVVCIRSIDLRCSPDGETPFTGVKIFKREIDAPEATVDPIFLHVNICLWYNSHPDAPMGCDIPAVISEGVAQDDSGNLVEWTPEELGLSF
jgi:hypothetical protein